MTNIVLGYWKPLPTFDTAIRFPIGKITNPPGDDVALIDGTSHILLVGGVDALDLGH